MPSTFPKAFLPRLALTLCLVCALPARAVAWGSAGHRIIARVAEANLSPAASRAVAELLGKEDIVSVSTYADEVRGFRPETTAWHFVEMPRNAQSYVHSRDCVYTSRGECMVAAIRRLEKVLKSDDDGATRGSGREFGKLGGAAQRDPGQETKVDALKFLVHLVGDLHQPLHCGYKDDAGGNRIRVSFGASDTNLHALWDTHLVAFAQREAAPPKGLGESEYVAKRLLPALGERFLQLMRNGDAENAMKLLGEKKPERSKNVTVEDWAFESYLLAGKIVDDACRKGMQVAAPPKGKSKGRLKSRVSAVMKTSAQSTVVATACAERSAARSIQLGDNYYPAHEKELDDQLLFAGVRLALILNDIFR